MFQKTFKSRKKKQSIRNFETKQTTGGGGGVGDYIDDVKPTSSKSSMNGGNNFTQVRNRFRTVKPLTLMNYLITRSGSRKGDVVLDRLWVVELHPLSRRIIEKCFIRTKIYWY